MGVPIAYSINVVNEGPRPNLRDIEIEDLLPPKSIYAPGMPTTMASSPRMEKFLWKLMAPSCPAQAWTVTLKIRPTEAGPYLNVARARGIDPAAQPVPSEDSHSTTQVTGAATADMEVRDSRYLLFVGEETTYSITVRNTGSAPATNIRRPPKSPPAWRSSTWAPRTTPAPPPSSSATFESLSALRLAARRNADLRSHPPKPSSAVSVTFRTTLNADILDPAKGQLLEEKPPPSKPKSPSTP